jgi:putative hemolysin
MSDTLLFLLLLLCVVVAAFFSAAETALTSLSDASVLRMKDEGRRNAVRLERLRADLPRTLGTILVGNNAVNTAAGTIGAAIAISHLGEKWGVIVATVVTTVVLLVVAEVTPKTLAARRPSAVALGVARPVELFVRLFAPLTGVLSRTVNALLSPFGPGRRTTPDLTEEDVRSVITLSHRQGALAPEETAILHAVLSFGDRPVREVMVPRARIVSLPVTASFSEIEAIGRESRYSRYPVWRENPDDVVGILHLKDLFAVTDAEERAFDMKRHLRPAIIVPELKRLEDLFREMRRHRYHMAIVVDESGAVAGLVTLEDLIEEIVGDILDEHDEPVRLPVSDGTSLIVEGAYPLASLERDLGVTFGETEVETAAGLLLRRFSRIPRAGVRWREGDLEFLVERASPRAIERIRITRTNRPAAGGDRKAS